MQLQDSPEPPLGPAGARAVQRQGHVPQRRFGLFDPAGVWIDVVEQIEPAPGWWDKYLV
jgi:hypothetical protein